MTAMFCYQCEQTAQGKGCTLGGVCGKTPQTAVMQDLLRALTVGISQYAHRARLLGKTSDEIDRLTYEFLFTTITNVNFDFEKINTMCDLAEKTMTHAAELYAAACAENCVQPEKMMGACELILPKSIDERMEMAFAWSPFHRIETLGADVAGLYELIIDGIKGVSAYAHHAAVLGYHDDEIAAYIHRAFSTLAELPSDTQVLLELALECGHINIRTMALLDQANTSKFGHPEPTQVRVTPKQGKCILVSGHDLKDLAAVLEATEGKGINVYTHGEMLPCNAYPQLKKYAHLVGHYGTAWQNQHQEFAAFPGAILMTTNCIQKPLPSYMDRIFTTGLVEFPDVKHLEYNHFKPLIDSALSQKGFEKDELPEKFIPIGFAHHAVMKVAPTVIEAVKSGAIKHFFLIGGCDGAKVGRNYYTEFAEKVPKNCVILTLACGKFRFNRLNFGNIGGIPRILDCGQCNDAYSAVLIATALAEAFKCQVNELPLSFIISWYEQKATAVLLSLLALGVQGIKLGPSLPAFLTPPVLEILVKTFNISPISTVDEDLKACLEK